MARTKYDEVKAVASVIRVMEKYFQTRLTEDQAREVLKDTELRRDVRMSGNDASDTYTRDLLIDAFVSRVLGMESRWPMNATPAEEATTFYREYVKRCGERGIKVK